MFAFHIKEYLEHVRLFSKNARWFLMGSFCMGFGFSVFMLLFNLYLKQLGYLEGTIGTILSASALGTVLIAIPAAILVDHVKVKRVLFMAAAVDCSILIIQAMSSNVWSLRMMAGVSGAMAVVHSVAASPFFMRNSNPKERPYLFGVNMALETVSGFLGMLLGGMVPRVLVKMGVDLLHGYRFALIGGAMVAFTALIFYGMLKSEKPIRTARFKLSEYFGARDWRTMLRLMIPYSLIGMGAGLVIPFLNIYFLRRFNLASDSIGSIFAVGSLFTTVGFLIGPVLAKRMGLVKITIITQFLSIPFFLILAFSHNLYLSIAAFFFRGSLMNMAWPMYNNFAMEIVPADQQAGTNSVMQLAWSGSWMISTSIGGFIIQNYGFTMVMLITVSLYLSSTISAWVIFRHKLAVGRATAGKSLEEGTLSAALEERE